MEGLDGIDYDKFLTALQERLAPARLNILTEREAFQTHAELVEAMPQKWNLSGIRQSWKVEQIDTAHHSVENDNRIFRFLDKGTKPQVAKSGKKFFIPLTKRAAVAYASGNRSAKLKYGKDYILVKKHKGIEARDFSGKQNEVTQERFQKSVDEYVAQALQEAIAEARNGGNL